MNKIIYTYILLFLTSCVFLNNDVYKEFPKGTILSKEILANGKQIIINDEYIFLLYDLSKNQEQSKYHLLFFDKKNLMLKRATFIDAAYIRSVDNKTIKVFTPIYKYKQKHLYRNDLPKGYKIEYITRGDNFKTLSQGNSLIENIIFKSEEDIVINVKVSKEKYIGIGKINIDSIFISRFQRKDSIQTHISKILYSFPEKKITVFDSSSNAELFYNVLIVPNNDIFYNFFEDVIGRTR